MYVDKDKFVWYICIDGLDCSGKETFAKQVVKMANEGFQNFGIESGFKVHYLSFPDYETESGKKIAEILKTDVNHRNNDELVALFAINRKEALDKLEYTKYNAVVFDRFAISNIIYGMLPCMIESGFKRTYKTDSKFYELCIGAEKECTNSHIEIDKLFIFSRFGSISSKKRHEALLCKKENKDANESTAIQQYLSDIIDIYFNEEVIEEIWDTQDDDAMRTMMKLGIIDMTKVKIGYTFSMSRSIKLIQGIVSMMDTVLTVSEVEKWKK